LADEIETKKSKTKDEDGNGVRALATAARQGSLSAHDDGAEGRPMIAANPNAWVASRISRFLKD
jgi:hypothetical protein